MLSEEYDITADEKTWIKFDSYKAIMLTWCKQKPLPSESVTNWASHYPSPFIFINLLLLKIL